jgi:tripartite-type tricarboxylate transporter receptor subunit TctC
MTAACAAFTFFALFAPFTLFTLYTSATQAQNYPVKPVRIVVPFAPGGPVDFAARTVGSRLSADFGQPVVIDNRPGAAGIIGADVVAKSTPDGYTLLLTTGTMSTTPYFYKKLPYDTVRDFAPLTMVVRNTGHVLTATPNLPARSIREFVAYAKANPGKLNFGSAGYGNTLHLAAEHFNLLAGIKATHIQYKGNVPALTDLASGQIDYFFPDMPTAMPFIQSGRARALGTSGMQRAKLLPEVPTIDEAGIKGFRFYGWFALFARAGTPPAIISRLHRGVVAAIADTEIKQRFDELGLEGIGSTPAEFTKFFAEDREFYRDLAQKIGAVPQ